MTAAIPSPSPPAPAIIADFVAGADFLGLSANLTFEQLAITQGTGTQTQDTLIRIAGSDELAGDLGQRASQHPHQC